MKKWYRQKTTWAGIASIVSGLGGICTCQMDVPTGSQLILAGFIAIFLRQGVEKIK